MKVLMVGLGGVGQRHARNLRSVLSDRVDLLAYRVRGQSHVIGPSLQADHACNVEEELSIRAFSDLGKALEQRPDVAIVSNPTSLHIRTAMACLRGGCDLLIEKPLSDGLDGVAELMRTAAEMKRLVMVGYQLRFHPCVRTLASLLNGGELGEILAVRAVIGEYLPDWHRYEDYRDGYAARRSLGGGVILTQIHELDYLYSLFGPIKSVYAIGGHWSHLDIDTEDVASLLMEATIGDRPLPIYVQQDYLQSPPVRQCEILGDRRKAVADFLVPSVTVSGRNQEPIVHKFPGFDRNQVFIDEITHFLASVADRSRPIVDLHDAVHSLTVGLAAKKSILNHAVVDIDTAGLVAR